MDPEDPSAIITRWSLTGSDAGDFTITEKRRSRIQERPGLRQARRLGEGQRLQLLGAGLGRQEVRLSPGRRDGHRTRTRRRRSPRPAHRRPRCARTRTGPRACTPTGPRTRRAGHDYAGTVGGDGRALLRDRQQRRPRIPRSAQLRSTAGPTSDGNSVGTRRRWQQRLRGGDRGQRWHQHRTRWP